MFSDPENAASELRLVLPAPLSAAIEWSTLELCPGSFVHPRLSQQHTDLLFKVRYAGHDVHLYLLFEHQSTEDRLMPFRLLQYMVRIWEAFLRDNEKAELIPPIIPVVLHHSANGWSVPTSLSAILDIPVAARPLFAGLLPELSFLLEDISAVSDAVLALRNVTVEVTLFLLRDARTAKDLLERLHRRKPALLQILEGPRGPAAFAIILEYAAQVGEISPEDLERFVHELGPIATETYMTTAEMLRAQGEARGEAKGKAQLFTRQLAARFGTVPDAVVRRISAGASTELDQWAERVLTAKSIEDVFAG